MIQRIQTIFLICYVGAMGGLFALPFATSVASQSAEDVFADGIYSVHDNTILQVLAVLGIAVALFSIFRYKQRTTQLKLGYLLIVLAIMIPVVALLYYTNMISAMADGVVHDAAGLFLPFAAIVFAILANYFIRKDERLIQSMDRLR
jgi:uncharacterized membrane protein YidH (DUF202 family)